MKYIYVNNVYKYEKCVYSRYMNFIMFFSFLYNFPLFTYLHSNCTQHLINTSNTFNTSIYMTNALGTAFALYNFAIPPTKLLQSHQN